jgi:hypothetical protein
MVVKHATTKNQEQTSEKQRERKIEAQPKILVAEVYATARCGRPPSFNLDKPTPLCKRAQSRCFKIGGNKNNKTITAESTVGVGVTEEG